MLLRKISKHVTDQNWFAVFIDFLIVVVGVFIGIQVANWNAALGNKALANEYLNRLTVDFENIEYRIKANIEYIDDSIAANKYINSVIALSIEPEIENQNKFKEALKQVYGTRIPGWQSATFLEMQSAGDINLIKNKSLKAALTEYNQATEVAHTGFKALVDERLLLTKIIDRFVQYEHNKSTDFGGYDISGYDFSGMVGSTGYLEELNSLLKIQSNIWKLQQTQLTKAQTVLTHLTKLERQ